MGRRAQAAVEVGMPCAHEGRSQASDQFHSGARLRPTPALLRGAYIVQVQGRSDESEMRKGLRKIADLPPRVGIVLFREQADIVAEGQQAFEQGRCFGVTVLQRIIVGKPEAAGKKYALSSRQTINAGLGAITEYEAIDDELFLDCGYGPAHPRIVGRQESHDRQQQEARIELATAEALGECVAAAIESLLANGCVHV